jgi:hypothetical protein
VDWAKVPTSAWELDIQVGRGTLLLAEPNICPEEFSNGAWVVLQDVDALASK